MLGTRAYFRTLAGLLRAAPRNPIVVAGSPWRSGWVPLLWAAAQLLTALLLLVGSGAAVLLAGLQFQRDSHRVVLPFLGSFSHNDMMDIGGFLLVCSVLVALAAFPLNLLAFSNRWMEPRRLEELLLTRLGVREMAVGSVFWAVLLGAAVPLALGLGGGSLLLSGMVLEDLSWRGELRFDDDLMGIGVAILVVLLVVAGVGCASLRVWFHLIRHKWPILLVGPLVCIAYMIAVGFLSLLGAGTVESLPSSWLRDLAMTLWFLAVSTLVVAHVAHSAGKLAPSLFIRAADMEPYRVASVVANSGMRVYSRAVRARVRDAVRRRVARPWLPSLVAFFAALLLVLVWNSVLRHVAGKGASPVLLIVYSLPTVLAVASALLVVRMGRDRGIVLVNGAIEASLLRLLLPLHLLMILPLFWVVAPVMAQEELPTVEGLVSCVGMLLLLAIFWFVGVAANMAAVAWWLRPGTLWWMRLVAHVSVPLFLGTLAFLNVAEYGEPTFPPLDPDVLAGWFVAAGLLAAYRAVEWLQRLYESTVMGLEHGQAVRLVDGRTVEVLEEPPQGSL